MKCPRCHLALQTKNMVGCGFIVLDVCPRCEGSWFDMGELDRLDNSLWTNTEEIEFHRIGGDRECFACPKCRSGMVSLSPFDAKDVVVDRCPICKGFWLNAGDLEKMQDVAALLDERKLLHLTHYQRPPDWSHLRWIIYCFKKFKSERSAAR